MIKLLCILLGSFWLSCGNTHETAQNKTTFSEEKTKAIPVISADTLLMNDTIVPSKETVVKTKAAVEVIVSKEESSHSLYTPQENSEDKEKVTALPDHEQWNALLATYVNAKGDVNYKSFLRDILALEEYLNHLAENSPEKDWLKNEKLAYYINLYNAATVKLILDNYPTKSIKEIKNAWGRAWVKTGDGKLSLGAIEHKILRKMNEPRIHFAINCASYSCPKLLNEAFTANLMEAQLRKVTLAFVNDSTKNIISEEKMQLSNIFKWYKKDFTENGSLVDYIKAYTKIEIDKNTAIDYLKYDWNLNEAK
jgi:hypothetical protein